MIAAIVYLCNLAFLTNFYSGQNYPGLLRTPAGRVGIERIFKQLLPFGPLGPCWRGGDDLIVLALVQDCDLKSVTQAREFAGRVIATASGGLHADRAGGDFLEFDRQIKYAAPVGVRQRVAAPDIVDRTARFDGAA